VCVEIREQVEELEKWAKQAQKFQQIFGSNLTRYPALDDLVSDISLKKGMWQARPVQTVSGHSSGRHTPSYPPRTMPGQTSPSHSVAAVAMCTSRAPVVIVSMSGKDILGYH
jgi:hypothetical protein